MPGPPGDFGEKGGPGMKGGPGDKVNDKNFMIVS